MEVIDLCSQIQTHMLTFVLNPNNEWCSFSQHLSSYTSQQWEEIKYLDSSGNRLNPDIEYVPSDSGGIYVFVIRPNIIPGTHLYIAYIGRARYTDQQNLRKRVKHYLTDDRPKIQNLLEKWGEYLYLRYLPLNDNQLIDEMEDELIRVVLPPCNNRFPKVYNRAMIAAFS